MYAHGNEPSHHVAYLYNYAGQPWKTQELVGKILRSFYTAAPDGVIGNEDCGQMSSWYVLSALGLYPVDPVSRTYVFGSPIVRQASMTVGNGKTFSVVVHNGGLTNMYIQAVSLNGKELLRNYLTHDEIVRGGELVFTMGSRPNKEWGNAAQAGPPSMSSGSGLHRGEAR
jgi:predicted alpha-1,2-mannosidase